MVILKIRDFVIVVLIFGLALASCTQTNSRDGVEMEKLLESSKEVHVERLSLTPEQCQELGGFVVGDIGDGAIFTPEFRCESGLPPIANIGFAEGIPLMWIRLSNHCALGFFFTEYLVLRQEFIDLFLLDSQMAQGLRFGSCFHCQSRNESLVGH